MPFGSFQLLFIQGNSFFGLINKYLILRSMLLPPITSSTLLFRSEKCEKTFVYHTFNHIALGSNFFLFSCSFRGKIGQQFFEHTYEVGAPLSGKSWIRHCIIALMHLSSTRFKITVDSLSRFTCAKLFVWNFSVWFSRGSSLPFPLGTVLM